MIDWLKANWRTIAHVALLVACWALYRFAPQAGPERELLASIAMALGLFGTAAVPSFASPGKGDGE